MIVKEKRDLKEVIKQIAELVDGPVSAEVIATEAPEMVKEAHELVKLGKKRCHQSSYDGRRSQSRFHSFLKKASKPTLL